MLLCKNWKGFFPLLYPIHGTQTICDSWRIRWLTRGKKRLPWTRLWISGRLFKTTRSQTLVANICKLHFRTFNSLASVQNQCIQLSRCWLGTEYYYLKDHFKQTRVKPEFTDILNLHNKPRAKYYLNWFNHSISGFTREEILKMLWTSGWSLEKV